MNLVFLSVDNSEYLWITGSFARTNEYSGLVGQLVVIAVKPQAPAPNLARTHITTLRLGLKLNEFEVVE